MNFIMHAHKKLSCGITISTLFLLLLSATSKKDFPVAKPEINKAIFLIDGSGFLYRAYYGLRPLHTPQGIPVQAVYSFCRMIKKIMNTFHPEHMALVWDSKGKTVRHEIFPEYKATRQAPPSDLFDQKQYIQQFADLIGLKQIEQSGVEADDLLYSLAQDYAKQGNNVVILTSDKDMTQTLDDAITIYDSFKDVFITADSFLQNKGFSVEKLPFYFALVGDSSDNIPGVKGIGEKTATELVKQFNSLEDLYENLATVSKERIRTMLAENKANAFLSEKLFRLHYYDLHISKEMVTFHEDQWQNAAPLFQELNFKSLLEELSKNTFKQTHATEFLSKIKGYTFKTITTMHDLNALCEAIKETKIMALDTELNGLKPLENEVIGLCICYQKGTSYYIPFGHITLEQQLSKEAVFTAIAPLLLDPSIKKVMHHAKFDELALWHYKLGVNNLTFDTLVAAQLVTKDWQRINLKALSEHYLHEKMLSFQEVVTEKKLKNFSQVPLDLATEYAAADAHQTLQLVPILQKELQEQGMEDLYYTIELPLISVLFAMEAEGIYLDTELLKKLDILVTRDLDIVRNLIIDLSGEQFKDINLNSPKQVEQLLFYELKLPPQKKSSKRTGYSTDVEVLQELAKIHPVPKLLLQYRELYKLKSTYIDALPLYINPQTGKIHTNFSQTIVATGRLSSSDPNLQNIPVESPYDIHVRAAFKPKEGHVFLSADYSQIELRVLAYLSQDKQLVDAFLHDQDIHAKTAANLFDVTLDRVTHEQRQIGKRINFSILYGLTPYGLSQDLGISFKEAKNYIEKYFAQYPLVSTWMEHILEETNKHGYVTTISGRRRYVPGIYEKNKMLYDAACRIAINTTAQGTAAEIMKRGMIALHTIFAQKKLDAKLVIQIHDELIISVAQAQKEEVEKIVKNTLETIVDWNVPLKVTTRFGSNWQEVTK